MIDSLSFQKAKVFGLGMVAPESRYHQVEITDIPLMITQEGHILCIPNFQEVKHIGTTSMTGTCKSLFLNALLGWDYWLMKRLCVNINDFQQETFEQSMPSENIAFQYMLKKINATPCPTPFVYVFPSTNSLKIDEKRKNFPHLKMTLPVEEVIKNVENYFSLDKSKVYLGNLINELVGCTSIGEIRNVLDENIPEKHTMMKYKLMNIFESLFENSMLNVAVPDAPAYLELYRNEKRYMNLTIQTIMAAGLVPSIQTSDLRTQDYFSAYMAFIIDSIYKGQYEDPFFKNQIVSMFIDEIDKLWLGHNGGIVKKSLNLIGTNGRAARIGLRWSTQHYEILPDQIRGNTKYLFVARKSNADEVRDIKKDFNVPKSMEKDILELKTEPKKGLFEMVALTTENFVLYTQNGKKIISSDAYRGTFITPMARHFNPSEPLLT